jgi:hypothetical protein
VCGKEIRISSIEGMKARAATLMCLLEKVLPTDFFDIQTHLLAHLVDEVEYCGPVHARWMFWVERHLKVLKGYVSQASRPEGCMVADHLHYESMFYASKAIQLFQATTPTI